MTWPIDLSEELKELDDQQDTKADYTVLFLAQISYKAALLKPGVLKALFSVMLPSLAKDRKYVMLIYLNELLLTIECRPF
jgi:replication fork protection complex subunit Tof1/Swi1